MPLLSAICTQCGATLKIDSEQETVVCPYCDTPFVDLTLCTNSSRERLANAGETFLKLGDYVSAKENFLELSELYPNDYRGWWGQIKVITGNFTIFDSCYSGGNAPAHTHRIEGNLRLLDYLFEKTRKVAPDGVFYNLNLQYSEYIEKYKADFKKGQEKIELLRKEAKEECSRFLNIYNDEKDKYVSDMQRRIDGLQKQIDLYHKILKIIYIILFTAVIISFAVSQAFDNLFPIFCVLAIAVTCVFVASYIFGERASALFERQNTIKAQKAHDLDSGLPIALEVSEYKKYKELIDKLIDLGLTKQLNQLNKAKFYNKYKI